MCSQGRSSGRVLSRAHVSFVSTVVSGLLIANWASAAAPAVEPAEEEEVVITTHLVGEKLAVRRAAEGSEPRALATGDFDEDGVADLVVGLGSPTGGALVIHRGNLDALFPNSREATQRRLRGSEVKSPFVSPARVWTTPRIPDRVAAGDFDADGHLDVLAASRGAESIYLHRGDGAGGLRPEQEIVLPGVLTALVSGEINRRDGLSDLAIGVRAGDRADLLIFEGPQGALAAPPEIVALEIDAEDLTLGEFDGLFGFDLAIVGAGRLFILSGRDRRLLTGVEVSPALKEIELSQAVVAVAAADLAVEEPSRTELAVLVEGGAIHLVDRANRRLGPPRWRTENRGDSWTEIGDGEWLVSPKIGHVDGVGDRARNFDLLPVRMSGAPTEDLLVVGRGGDRSGIRLVATPAKSADANSRSAVEAPDSLSTALETHRSNPRPSQLIPYGTTEVKLESRLAPPLSSVRSIGRASQPRAIVRMRLNSDALDDLVVVSAGLAEPVAVFAKAGETVFVDSTTDVVDGSTTSISDLTASPGPDGVIGLREAITAANNTIGADAISFNIPIDTDPGCDAGSGVCTIQPGGNGLPIITQPVTIDGTTQPSFQMTPVIEIDGSLATVDATGLAITAGSSTVRGLVINRFSGNSDIVMWIAGGNVVEGNFLGVDASGTFNQGTTNSVHVFGITNNTIGGTNAAARNVISGNTNPGVALNGGASFNQVTGNFFGTDLTGTIALGNSGNDVVTLDSPNNTIGGTAPGAGNVVAGGLDPTTASVGLGFPASAGNLVQGNYIGTDITGTVDLGGASIGAYVGEGVNNTIGGTSPAAGNLVSGGDSSGVGIAVGSGNLVQGNLIGTQIDGVTPLPNASHGVLIYSGAANNTVGGRIAGEGNTIAFNGASGVDLRGDAGTGNAIAGNSIFMNTDLGINLCADFDDVDLVCNDATAVLPNDSADPDVGANNLQNFPVLSSDLSGRNFSGSLDSIASSDYTLDFYASRVCDPSGYGEGELYLGGFDVTTDSGGGAAFAETLPRAAPAGWFVVATATDSTGNTSEFSQCFEILEDPIFADGFESGDTFVWSSGAP